MTRELNICQHGTPLNKCEWIAHHIAEHEKTKVQLVAAISSRNHWREMAVKAVKHKWQEIHKLSEKGRKELCSIVTEQAKDLGISEATYKPLEKLSAQELEKLQKAYLDLQRARDK